MSVEHAGGTDCEKGLGGVEVGGVEFVLLIGLDKPNECSYTHHMDSMVALKAAVTAYTGHDLSAFTTSALGDELRELRAIIDALEVKFSSTARTFQVRGGHLTDGYPGVVSWLRLNCKMSGPTAADRVCVGKELESLPHTAESLASGRLGFQSAAAICHLYEQAAERREDLDEEALVVHAEQMGVAEVRDLCRRVRYAVDPEGSARDEEFNFSRRKLHISALSDGMHVIDAILDPVGGAAVKTALGALATSGARDDRKHSQRMADALVEMVHHTMDEGRLPTKHSVRAHLNISTTLEALQGLPGAATSELELETAGCAATEGCAETSPASAPARGVEAPVVTLASPQRLSTSSRAAVTSEMCSPSGASSRYFR